MWGSLCSVRTYVGWAGGGWVQRSLVRLGGDGGVDGGGDTAGLGPLASPPRPTWSRPRQPRPGRRSPCCARLLGLGTPGEIFTED